MTSQYMKHLVSHSFLPPKNQQEQLFKTQLSNVSAYVRRMNFSMLTCQNESKSMAQFYMKYVNVHECVYICVYACINHTAFCL